MTQPFFSRLPHDRTRAIGRIETRGDVGPLITSQAFDWPGVMLEAGRSDITGVEDLTLAHHYVCLNTDVRPLTMHVQGAYDVTTVALQPGNVWVLPAGETVTVRLDSPFTYIRLTLDPQHLNKLLSPDERSPVELKRTFNIAAPQLAYLLTMLVAEADLGNPGGLAFVESLIAALGYQLALHAGIRRSRPVQVRGGLGASARRRALALLDSRIGSRISIRTMAREVGLSTAHFARAFKETVGRAPHQYLLLLRLQRARRMLEAPGAVLSDVALNCGFADQAHLTRMFKREFGVTPGAVVRARRQN